jgi:hypothetical protein
VALNTKNQSFSKFAFTAFSKNKGRSAYGFIILLQTTKEQIVEVTS